MSLINQMLKDIEYRQALSSGANEDVVMMSQHAMDTSSPVVSVRSKRVRPFWLGFGCIALVTLSLIWHRLDLSKITPSQNEVLAAEMPIENTADKKSEVIAGTAHILKSSPLSFQPSLDKQLHFDINRSEKLAVKSLNPEPVKPMSAVYPMTHGHSHEISADMSEEHIHNDTVNMPAKSDASPAVIALSTAAPKGVLSSAPNSVKVEKRVSETQQAAHEYQLAIGYLQQGRIAEAMEKLHHVIKLDTMHHDARKTLIGLLIENKHPREAMQYLQSGLLLFPDHWEDVQLLARLYEAEGELEHALSILDQYAGYAHDDAEYHGLKAALLQKSAHYAAAIEHYQKALKQVANYPPWLIGLGICQENTGQYEAAKITYASVALNRVSPELAAFVTEKIKQIP